MSISRQFRHSVSYIDRSRYYYCTGIHGNVLSVLDVATEAYIFKGAAVDIHQWFWEVCSTALCHQSIIIGPGNVVQIDESQFAH